MERTESTVPPTHVRCASAGRPSAAMRRDISTVRPADEPPAPQVTEMKSGLRLSRTRATSIVDVRLASVFGGNTSNETVIFFCLCISDIVMAAVGKSLKSAWVSGTRPKG